MNAFTTCYQVILVPRDGMLFTIKILRNKSYSNYDYNYITLTAIPN